METVQQGGDPSLPEQSNLISVSYAGYSQVSSCICVNLFRQSQNKLQFGGLEAEATFLFDESNRKLRKLHHFPLLLFSLRSHRKLMLDSNFYVFFTLQKLFQQGICYDI